MKAYHMGYYIRAKREEQGIIQDDLCRGICDRSTLSRIERGKVEPSPQTFKALLQRLGEDEGQFALLLGPRDFEIANLEKEIVSLNAQKRFEQAKEKISQLEKLADPEDKVTAQFILRSKALAYHHGDYPVYRQMLMEALSITHPEFDFERIDSCLLTVDEVKILNQIAITYSETGERRYAIHIYGQLFRYLKKGLLNTESGSRLFILLTYNYSRLLGREGRAEECVEVAQLGRKACIRYNECRMLGGLLHNMGCALHDLGQDEESKRCLTDAFYAHRIMERWKSCEVVRKYAKENFDMEFPD